MDQFSSTTDDNGPGLACAVVVSLLSEGGEPSTDRDGAIERIVSHVERCAECNAALDALVPEQALPALAERLVPQARARISALGSDASREAAAAALLLIEGGGEMKDEGDEIAGRACEVVVLAEVRECARALAAQKVPDPFQGQFLPGQLLCGSAGKYVIKELTKSKEFSEVYEATVQGYVAGSDLREPGRVVIKIPRVAADMSDQGAAGRLSLLGGLLQAVVMTERRLVGSEHVAQLVDHGEYDHRLNTNPSRSVFVVYRYVEGLNLAQYMNEQHKGRFTGLAHAKEFFAWARKLTASVVDTHQRLVIHGDICPRNIIVDREHGRPVFVDLGQSLFVHAMNGLDGFRGNPYRAPDDEKTPSSDLFSLGGVLYYLATGSDPHGLGHCNDVGLLKQQVEDKIREVNPALFEEEGGVVDVIARCLRKQGRVQHAAQLLEDIEMCKPSTVPGSLVDEVGELQKLADQLDGAGNALFHWVAGLRMRNLLDTLKDMNRGVLDFSGDAKDICSAACALFRALEEGDEFLAISLPQFWNPGNMGINGRFLTMNRMAAARGVRIQRILVVDSDLADRHLEEVVAAQRKVAADLRYSKDYSVKCITMAPEARRQFIREGKHFGLFIRGGECIAMFPVYSEEGKLVTLRFRTDERLVHGLRGIFSNCVQSAVPLADLDLSRSRSTRGM